MDKNYKTIDQIDKERFLPDAELKTTILDIMQYLRWTEKRIDKLEKELKENKNDNN